MEAVFVCLGIYPNNHILTNDEAIKLQHYLDAGGNVYMEGDVTWYFDTQTVVHPYFHINAVADVTSDLFSVSGEPGSVYANMYFPYNS